ncbi:hypothetical protein MUO66_01075 [Candidatus Bathyarchaeota archaeon]|nr:hypothetical protein [Candidatus Bathyarchaeota archaeon]
MNRNYQKKCPKCYSKMETGALLGACMWLSNKKQTNPRDAEKIFGYGCKKCGFVEFYLRKA